MLQPGISYSRAAAHFDFHRDIVQKLQKHYHVSFTACDCLRSHHQRVMSKGRGVYIRGKHVVAGCKGINNSTLVNVLPSCTETEHSQQEVLTLTQMSSPVTTDTDATQHPDTTRPGNASKRADSAQKQLDRTPPPTRLHLSPLSAFLRRITWLTTQRELRTPRGPATQQQRAPASQLEARARSRDVPTAAYATHYGAHSLNPKTRALPHSSPFYQKGMSTIEMTTKEKTHSLVMNLATISKFVVAPTYYNLDRLTKFSFSPK